MDFSINPQALRTKSLFKRCVECDPVTTASCPPCAAPNVCILTSATCQSCPEYLCQSENVAGTVDPKEDTTHSSTPAPQIAGGVVGGIFLIALFVFIIWKFVLKGRRHTVVEEWDPTDYPLEKPGTIASIRDSRSRASTHTVASVATTVLTRASNVIQIAYIPGVTNRQASSPQSPTSSTHIPVPPVPIPTNPPSETLSATASGQLLFLPSDLRDSTYTDLSELDAATRKSISPSLARQSYASTVFHQESAMPTAVLKAKPSLVSVSKSSTTSSPCPTPPVPSIDHSKFAAAGAKPVLLQIPIASENGKKAPTTLATATPMKAKALFITKNKGSNRGSGSTTSTATPGTPKAGRITSLAESQTTIGSPHTRAKQFEDDESSDDDDGSGHERSRRSLLKRDASPFGDHAAADFEAASKSKTKGESPFGDDHAL